MKFYHLADIHLGAEPDRNRVYSKKRAEEIWDTFRKVLVRAKEEKPDCIFISGDLFHRQPLKRELKEVDYLFSGIPDTLIFLMAGNHDWCNKKSAYLNFAWSPNVRFIDSQKITSLREERLNLTVYGHSYWEREISEPLYDVVKPESEEGIHVLMAHGGDGSHVPMNYHRIGSNGFDYVAMGHIHKPGIHKEYDMAYAGALEPLDLNETGNHGYIEGTILPDTVYGGYRTELAFVEAACRKYVHLEIELKEEMTEFELEDVISREMHREGEENLFKIILKGTKGMHFRPDPERICRLGNVTAVEDQSRPVYDMDFLKEKYRGNLIGAYLSGFEGEELSDQEELVRRIGLEVLLETMGGPA